MTKIIAFHLPQFHSIPENDEWWGKGFTEWVNTKKAKPLYKNHIQPKEPLNDNYYNMLDKETLKWQCDLSTKYGIYGFCYYHYWFNGKLLLEKPVENLLQYKDINQKFCFCWANEPWTRAWDGAEQNVLINQLYGDEEDWKNHFEYLLKFFKDERYILIDNKPVLVIYRTSNIDKCDEMIGFWDQLCIENGFDGIYVVEEKNSFQDRSYCMNSKAIVEFEPMYTVMCKRNLFEKIRDKIIRTWQNCIQDNKLRIFYYDKVWKNILNRKIENTDKKQFLGAFVDWDNTARKNKNGMVIKGANPEKFQKYLDKQVKRAENINSEFVFVNAWNEWGEGTYLEPDKYNKFGYLEAIKKVVDNNVR